MAQDKAGRKTETKQHPSGQQPAGKNWLLAIAIDKYAHKPLNNCVRDVKAFIEVVSQRYNFEDDHIIPLFNEAATADGIYDAFEDLLDKVKPNDNLIVYYSGHGDYHGRLKEGYWIPFDADTRSRQIPNDALKRYLREIQTRHTLIICDSCFSGTFAIKGKAEDYSPEALAQRYQDSSRWVITSGSKHEVLDGMEGGHSPFAEALLAKMRSHEGDLSARNLGDYVISELAAKKIYQKPLSEVFDKEYHQGGLFVFWQKTNEEADWNIAEAENTITAYMGYRMKYPKGIYYTDAKWRIKKLEEADEKAWRSALNFNKIYAYEDYIDNFPHGYKVKEARKNIENLLSGIKINDSQLEVIPQMMFVEGGEFHMGSNFSNDEQPIHKVKVSNFRIGVYPITFEEYDTFCEQTGNEKPDDLGWGRGKRPVVKVDWFDAVAYTTWLSKRTGKNFRLPTEAEWEYVARGGRQNKGYIYSGSNNLDEVGWYDNNSNWMTHPVGHKKPNELGIYDMSGNIWEWCFNWFDKYYYETQTNPQGPIKGVYRVLRGGSSVYVESLCRNATRFRSYPNSKADDCGFRIVLD